VAAAVASAPDAERTQAASAAPGADGEAASRPLTTERRTTYGAFSLPVPGIGGSGLTGPGGVILGGLLVGLGTLLDLALGTEVGLGVQVTLVAAAIGVPLLLRIRALLTGVLLPPLLYLAAVLTLARLGGGATGSRELVLETTMTLALTAPLLFAATGLAVLVTLGRLVLHVVQRHR
jgi:hypothetical protein